MKLNQLTRNNEPKPRSSMSASAAGVELTEGLEDLFRFILGESTPCINN
jgi:hypothetical protein